MNNIPPDPLARREGLYSLAGIVGAISTLLLLLGCGIVCVALFFLL